MAKDEGTDILNRVRIGESMKQVNFCAILLCLENKWSQLAKDLVMG